jgi:C4-dicarboxylate-specific signal transduction histidine kinase
LTLTVAASAERVLIEIQDECGGLQGGNADDLFRPFEQRSADRTGAGLGLAFSPDGTRKRTMAGSTRAACRVGDASSLSICRGAPFPP